MSSVVMTVLKNPEDLDLSGHEVMKLFLLINVKMLTTVGILTFLRRKLVFKAYLSLKKKLNFLIF